MELTRFMVKDLNLDLLQEELVTAGLPPNVGMLIAGFRHDPNDRLRYNSFTEREVIATATGQPDVWAEPGELQFRYESGLTSRQEAALDKVLLDHDATGLSRAQINDDQDVTDCQIMAENYRNWDVMTPPQKEENARIMTRLTARLQDGRIDL